MDKQEIKETVKDANIYLNNLQNLYMELSYAEQQIGETAIEAETNINVAFSDLLRSVTTTLSNRRDELINRIKGIQEKGSLPLIESKDDIVNKMDATMNLIAIGEDMLKSDNNHKGTALEEFTIKSRLLGSLPEVPQLKEVPCLSFQYDRTVEKHLTAVCHEFGCVLYMAPVQIFALTEKPGGILVEWTHSDLCEYIKDIQEYHLQKALRKHPENSFRTCYIGTDMQYLVKGLCLNEEYIFRVCCKFEGETEWSPWSVPQHCRTTLEPFYWNSKAINFKITNDNKVAVHLKNKPSFLFTDKIDFKVGYSVEFTILEYDSNTLKDTWVGLFTLNNEKEFSAIKSESVYVNGNGFIYEAGIKKATQFDSFIKGTKVCFSCDLKDQQKLRINIDCSGKRVTYDWLINDRPIYVGAKFSSNKWKIMID